MSSDAGDGADYNALLVCLKGTTFGNELKAQAVREFAQQCSLELENVIETLMEKQAARTHARTHPTLTHPPSSHHPIITPPSPHHHPTITPPSPHHHQQHPTTPPSMLDPRLTHVPDPSLIVFQNAFEPCCRSDKLSIDGARATVRGCICPHAILEGCSLGRQCMGAPPPPTHHLSAQLQQGSPNWSLQLVVTNLALHLIGRYVRVSVSRSWSESTLTVFKIYSISYHLGEHLWLGFDPLIALWP